MCIYTFVGFIYDGLEVFLTYSIGLRIAPQFDKPFLADSLANFWGRRWNLPVGMCLRQTIYDPICEGTAMCTFVMPALLPSAVDDC